MTCAEFAERLDGWLAGILSETDARAVEQHAAECASCGELLEARNRPLDLPREVMPPPALRGITLQAVARRRRLRSWRRGLLSAAGIAALALLTLLSRPRVKSASDFPGAGQELLARAHARPEFGELDAAERDIERALRDHPGDADLTEALQRIRRQREELQHLVSQVRS